MRLQPLVHGAKLVMQLSVQLGRGAEGASVGHVHREVERRAPRRRQHATRRRTKEVTVPRGRPYLGWAPLAASVNLTPGLDLGSRAWGWGLGLWAKGSGHGEWLTCAARHRATSESFAPLASRSISGSPRRTLKTYTDRLPSRSGLSS